MRFTTTAAPGEIYDWLTDTVGEVQEMFSDGAIGNGWMAAYHWSYADNINRWQVLIDDERARALFILRWM